MCDRNQVEVVARELAICNWIGNRKAVLTGEHYEGSMSEWTEEHYEDYKKWARVLIEMVNTHEAEND